MAVSSCFCLGLGHPQVSLKLGLERGRDVTTKLSPAGRGGGTGTELIGKRHGCSFSLGSSFLTIQPAAGLPSGRAAICQKKSHVVRCLAAGLPASQIANSIFTLGTAAVLPFYTLMVVAPRAQLTKRSMESSSPYVVLGLLYAYLLYLSWTPDTLRIIFANKYWMPELPGIAKMFSNEMTMASAWIHLLAVDLFSARQVYQDGLQNNIETRHSVSLCLLFCPVGVLTHFITKALTTNANTSRDRIH